jgi:leucyl aminopeptidase
MSRKLIDIKASSFKQELTDVKADLLALGVYKEDKKLTGAEGEVDKKLGGWLGKLLRSGDFKGNAGEIHIAYGDDKIGSRRVGLVGLGKKGDVKVSTFRDAAVSLGKRAVGLGCKSVAVALQSRRGKLDAGDVCQAIVEGAFIGAYKYDEFISEKKGDDDTARPGRISFKLYKGDSKAVKAGMGIGNAQKFARTLANRPPNMVTPAALAREARSMARKTASLSCSVLSFKQLKDKKMGGIIAVGQGSVNKPCMIVLKYKPSGKKAKEKVGLVGKAITFDAGGISIKPSQNMQDMKMDMAGGAGMLGVINAVAELKLKVEVTAIICAAENLPGGGSYRPGDIITTYSGKTVEIQNTDAEGRMVMSDGIHYAKEIGCDVIIDMATLTGACVVALGLSRAAVMSNDDKLAEDFVKAGEVSGERMWHLPCGEEYTKQMKSEIADLKNIGSKWAGACTAGSFLREFAGEEVKWAHLDIAGPGMHDPDVGSKSGSRGFGVRVVTEYLKKLQSK